MYEKYGSNVYLNCWTQISSGYTVRTGSIKTETTIKTGATIESENTVKTWVNNQSIDNRKNSDNEYISTVYENSNVIYTWKDGTKYYYDYKFLAMLRSVAAQKWESELAKYLTIEAKYFKDWLDQLSNIDDEELFKSMWIDIDNIDTEKMTKQEKQDLLKKFKSALGKIIDENKSRNNNLLEELNKVVKNTSNDQFWLKEKYKETKTFMDATNNFLDLYSKNILDLIELALMNEDGDNSEEWMTQALWLIWIALSYQWTAQEYQDYVEAWSASTLKLLWLD